MKILILIMSANKQPALRNEAAIFDTFVKSYNDNKQIFKHEYTFLTYRGENSHRYINNNILYLTSPDDIQNTFWKTLEAFNYIKDFEYDYIIRINISTYINLFILDEYIDKFDKIYIYCNTICTYHKSKKYLNEVFPRGDAYIIHKDLFNDILNFANNFNINDNIDDDIDKPDDSLFGVILSNYFNHKTHNYIKLLEYSYIPNPINYINSYDIKKSALVIFSRIKTCPLDASCSGYSWDDNEYRLDDIKKINLLNMYIFYIKNKNSNIVFNNNYNEDRFIINVDNRHYMASFNTIKHILE